MKAVLFISSLLIFNYLVSAYDIFQGLGKLPRPCFPVYDHKECNKTLLESYNPPNMGATSHNPATTQFYLFTPTSQNKAEQLHLCGGGLPPQSTFDINCSTEVFIHGWSDGLCRSAWMREMKEQLYQRRGCYNVILVDWTWGNTPDRAAAVQNSKIVAQQTAYVLQKISRQSHYDCRKLHIIGHSVGAIAGSYAGKSMQNTCRLGRLTTLDISLAPFLYSPEDERLSPSDAMLVDSISTNGGYCYPFNIGDPRPMGHVNFYVNDGTHQPSCYPYAFASILKWDLISAIGTLVSPALCSHLQSIQYYKVSILAYADDTQLIGVHCNSMEEWTNDECERNCEKNGNCLPMGMDTPLYIDYRNLSTDLSQEKSYYVPTTLLCPYSDHSGFKGLPLKPVSN